MAAEVVDAEYLKEIEEARRDLFILIGDNYCAPIMLRLAWHDAGTYDAQSKTGGPNGSIRNEEECNHRGLKGAMDLCASVKAKHPTVSYADLYQLAGVVAVDVSGGPEIKFIPGRKDSNDCPKGGRLADPKKGVQHLRDVFNRMGLGDNDIVALLGGHTLAMAHIERSGYEGPWTEEPFLFDNSYFVELLKGETKGLLKLPTDIALLEDPEFRSYVELYAKDEDAFFKDYAKSHKKLSELGFSATLPQTIERQNMEVCIGDVVRNKITGSVGILYHRDQIFPVNRPEAHPYEKEDSELLDRDFRIGDEVSRILGDRTYNGVGVVVGVKKIVDLTSDDMMQKDVATDQLRRIRGFFENDFVVQGNWMGQVTYTELSVSVKFSDGTSLSRVDPDPKVLEPVFTNRLEKLRGIPYYKGQRVMLLDTVHEPKPVSGVVTKQKVKGLCVSWFPKESGTGTEPPPPRILDETKVRLFAPPLFCHANWMLGSRCIMSGKEYLVCNFRPSRVTVQWRSGKKEEFDARELEESGLFKSGQFTHYFCGEFEIGDLVCREEAIADLPYFGRVSGVRTMGFNVAWEDGSTSEVRAEDIGHVVNTAQGEDGDEAEE